VGCASPRELSCALNSKENYFTHLPGIPVMRGMHMCFYFFLRLFVCFVFCIARNCDVHSG
jgi:hypothetical protein